VSGQGVHSTTPAQRALQTLPTSPAATSCCWPTASPIRRSEPCAGVGRGDPGERGGPAARPAGTGRVTTTSRCPIFLTDMLFTIRTIGMAACKAFPKFRVAQLIHNRQLAVPGMAGRPPVAVGALDVTEPDERAGLGVPVAVPPEQLRGPPVAVHRLGAMAGPVANVARVSHTYACTPRSSAPPSSTSAARPCASARSCSPSWAWNHPMSFSAPACPLRSPGRAAQGDPLDREQLMPLADPAEDAGEALGRAARRAEETRCPRPIGPPPPARPVRRRTRPAPAHGRRRRSWEARRQAGRATVSTGGRRLRPYPGSR
jgi:hypothetical protein